MNWNKGGERTISEKLWLLIHLAVLIIGLGVVYSATQGAVAVEGCEDYADSPFACIRDPACRPVEENGGIDCVDTPRQPNHRYNAAEDADCRCPDPYDEVVDGDDPYYGMCFDGDDYTVCEYPP